MTDTTTANSDSSQPLGLASTEELGLAPERAAFERWAAEMWGAEAYRHTSATSGEWEAWKAAAVATRENCAETIEVLVCPCCHKESEVEFARYLAGEIRGA